MMPGDIARPDLPPQKAFAGCWFAIPAAVLAVVTLLATGLQHSLQDLLSDGDLATVRGPLNRRAYAVRILAGQQVITLPERVRGRAGMGRGPIEDEGADIHHQAWLESMGWTR